MSQDVERDDAEYAHLLAEVKDHVRRAQISAARRVNTEVVRLYLSIGRSILARQDEEGYGTGVIRRLSRDLRAEFPGVKGFSERNLVYCQQAARHLDEVTQQLAAQLPWGHTMALLEKVDDPTIRSWYAAQAVEHGWTRDVLIHQVATRLHTRRATSPVPAQIPVSPVESELVRELVKDPYRLDFLGLDDGFTERQLEDAILTRLTAFLGELGPGFAFVGRQVPLRVGSEDFYPDLLAYHLDLRRFVVIELKVGMATPEALGKLSFYLSVVDAQLRKVDKGDGPSIGILLTATRDDVVVEYALAAMNSPMAAVTYQTLPDDVRGQLPSPDDLSRVIQAAEES